MEALNPISAFYYPDKEWCSLDMCTVLKTTDLWKLWTLSIAKQLIEKHCVLCLVLENGICCWLWLNINCTNWWNSTNCCEFAKLWLICFIIHLCSGKYLLEFCSMHKLVNVNFCVFHYSFSSSLLTLASQMMWKNG